MMNEHEKVARVTVEFDAIAELHKAMMDAIDAAWRCLRDEDDPSDDIARLATLSEEMRRELEAFEEVCHAV